MAEAAHAELHEHAHAHDHEHFGTVSTRLIITFVGGVLILNAYLADYFLFPGRMAVGAWSAVIGAIILGAPIVITGFKEMTRGRMHMSVLVAIAVLAAFTLGGRGEDSAPPKEGVKQKQAGGFKEAGIVAFFMLLASLIEQKTAQGARESVEKLMRFTPKTAELVSGKVVPVAEIKKGDRVRLRPGDNVPVDGRIVRGESSINEATVTGESLPADKAVGDEVFAGTSNLTGSLEVEVTRAGEDTTLGRVKRLILDAEATKTPVMQIIDKYAEWYTPVVLMLAGIIYVFTKDWYRVITALVVCCPCAFVLATPTAMVAGLSAAARLGILIKTVAHLEAAGDITAMVFDKTGTLTTGELTVTRMSPLEGVDGAELLRLAGSLEQNSRHPVARAVVRIARRANVQMQEASDVHEASGKGISGTVGGKRILVGRSNWLLDQGVDMRLAEAKSHIREVEGMSMLYAARDNKCIGWIGLEDRTREDAQRSTGELRDVGVKRLSMLTGDRWSVAKKVAAELGCTDVQAECLPEHKLRLVEQMRREGHTVAVVGDGVNDAPALAAGDLGIAMGAAGSDVAIDSASIALMSNDLNRLPFLIRLSRRVRRVIFQNLLFGVVFVVGGLLLSTFGYISPVSAAVLHNISSFIVIFNSARLVRFGENLSPYSSTVIDASAPTPVAA